MGSPQRGFLTFQIFQVLKWSEQLDFRTLSFIIRSSLGSLSVGFEKSEEILLISVDLLIIFLFLFLVQVELFLIDLKHLLVV